MSKSTAVTAATATATADEAHRNIPVTQLNIENVTNARNSMHDTL